MEGNENRKSLVIGEGVDESHERTTVSELSGNINQKIS
jgi:hypothetical protein